MWREALLAVVAVLVVVLLVALGAPIWLALVLVAAQVAVGLFGGWVNCRIVYGPRK